MQRAILLTTIGFLGAALAAAIVAMVQDNRRPEPVAADTEPSMLFPDATTLRVAAWLPVIAFVAMALTIPEIYVIQRLRIDSPWLVIPVFAAMPILGAHLFMAAVIRCPRCNLRLILNRQQRPRFGEPSKNRNAWGALLYRIRKGDRFRCMFCGQRYYLENPAQDQ